jgi:hypothetical protein
VVHCVRCACWALYVHRVRLQSDLLVNAQYEASYTSMDAVHDVHDVQRKLSMATRLGLYMRMSADSVN